MQTTFVPCNLLTVMVVVVVVVVTQKSQLVTG
jgi:hypothetical protein